MRIIDGGARAICAAVALLLVAAPARADRAKRPRAAAGPPADLIGVIAVRSLDEAHDGLAEFLASIDPSAADFITRDGIARALGGAAGLPQLEGIDLERPIRLLLLDSHKHARSAVLLAAISETSSLRKPSAAVGLRTRGGWVLVGGDAEVALVERWAFAQAARSPATVASLTLYPGALLAAYRADIQAARTLMSSMFAGDAATASLGKVVELEVDLFVALLEQTDELVIDLSASRQGARLEIACTPRPGTTVAKVVALQRPSDFALLRTLPADEAVAAIGGRFVFGPARGPMLDIGAALFSSLTGGTDVRPLLDAWADAFTGDMAMTMAGAADEGLSLQEVLGVADADAARSAQLALMRAFAGEPGKPRVIDLFGVRESIEYAPGAARYDGIPLDRMAITIDASAATGPQREAMQKLYPDGMKGWAGAFDRSFAFAFGAAAERHVHAIVDASRGRGARALPAGLARAVDEAKARKDSLIMFFDLRRLIAVVGGRDVGPSRSGLIWSYGFTDGRIRMRIELPVEHIQEMKSAQ